MTAAQWKQDFEKNGVIGPFKVYEPEEAKELLNKIRINNLDRSHILFDNDVNYDRHFDIPELTQHVGQLAITEKLRAVFGHENILCWRSEFFPKFPGAKGTEWHQVEDYRYASGEPQLVPIENYPLEAPLDLTVWTSFTDATLENGCMKFLPGSHRVRYFDESKQPAGGREQVYKSIEADTQFFGYNFADFKVDPFWEPDESQALAMEMKPGECVIFSARCVHASFPNITKRSTRFAITARYVPSYVRVYPDTEILKAHGAEFDLRNYGCVLVSGQDEYGHNRIRTTNNRGIHFPYNK
jgi:non-heme Fe2+,alpha-ketoglutarate-dependent halogenase